MPASERKLRGLNNRKKSIQSSFLAIEKSVNAFQAERDAVEVPVRLENLMALWDQFNTVQAELESLEESDEIMEVYLQERTEFERSYYRMKVFHILVIRLQHPSADVKNLVFQDP